MSKIYDFLKECGTFFVLTISDEFPVGRPFGAVMEIDNHLYISTSDTKNVYTQLKNNPHLQIVALKNGTRNWLRLKGIAQECTDLNLKSQMLAVCPILTKHFPDATTPHYTVFEISVLDYEFN